MSSDGRRSEHLVERWLRSRGLIPERFPLRRRRLGKTPDFRVATAAGENFLVEVKTLTSPEPTPGAIALKLIRARAQFDGVNQGGHVANVLALVARDPDTVAALLAELAAQPRGPLASLDAVLGLSMTAAKVAVLYAARDSRHAALIDRLLALDCEVPLGGRP